jgi:serine/threonine protein phosphatase 1
MKINIIGDIAGRFDELMLLLKKMPEADLVLSVGDMVDRGPKSKEVLEWFMEQQKLGKAEAIYGNHEDLMIAGVTKGDCGDWFRNGGTATAKNFLIDPNKEMHYFKDMIENTKVPEEIVEWLQKRPMYFQTDDLFVSHAPVTSLKNVPADPYGRDYYFIWNRWEPSKPQGKFMIYGHNGRFKIHKWGDGSEFAMCLDNSHTGRLTGIHWPTKEIFKQDFLDREEHKQYYYDDEDEE